MNETAPFNNNSRRCMPPSKSVAKPPGMQLVQAQHKLESPLSKYIYMAAIYQYFNMRSDIFRNF